MTDVADSAVESPKKVARIEQDLSLLAGDIQAENYGVGEDQRFKVESDWQPAGAQPEAIEALRLDLETRDGRVRTLEETQKLLGEAGLSGIQFSFLAASHVNLGLAIGVK